MRPQLAVFAILLVLSAGCSDGTPVDEPARAGAAEAALLEALDRDADPCQDFYRYACGNWNDQAQIPPDRTRFSRSFDGLIEANGELLDALFERVTAMSGDSPWEQRLGAYYGACMDEEGIDARGIEPLRSLLDEIGALSDLDGMMRLLGRLHSMGISVLFAAAPNPDLTGRTIAYFGQPELGLPDKGAYFREDDISARIREGYLEFVAQILELLGDDPRRASEAAESILAFETVLAERARSPQELRDIVRSYNKVDLPGLVELVPSLPWPTYLDAIGQPDLFELSIAVPEYYEGLEQTLPATDLDVIRIYLRYFVARHLAGVLPRTFGEARFALYGRLIGGATEPAPRTEFCRNVVDGALPDDLGRMFVESHFAGASRDLALAMTDDVRGGFLGGLSEVAWLDEPTMDWVHEKAAAMIRHIGFPDDWDDYEDLEIAAGDFFSSAVAVRQRNYRRVFEELGRRPDRQRWFGRVTQVNAFYNPTRNAIAFPAGILQPPFFHVDAPPAMNYGGIGVIIGHEISHGFDDQGRFFGADGTPGLWWTGDAFNGFAEVTQCVDDLYGGYETLPGLNLNGRQTLGENIADLGGVRASWEGYQQLRSRMGTDLPTVEGFTDEELFFISYAQLWCTVSTDEYKRNAVLTGVHSAARFRVQGALSQLPAFAETFACEQGTPMNPVDKCRVW